MLPDLSYSIYKLKFNQKSEDMIKSSSEPCHHNKAVNP